MGRIYTSVDPAPPTSGSGLLRTSEIPYSQGAHDDIPNLRATFLDTSLPLFQRYRAMFALRNIGNEAAVNALADGFGDDSDLFK